MTTKSEQIEQAEGAAADEALKETGDEPEPEPPSPVPVNVVHTDIFREWVYDNAEYTIFTYAKVARAGVYSGSYEIVSEATGEVLASETKQYQRRFRPGLHKTLTREAKAVIRNY